MKKITKKLSSKYVKLHKSRLRQEGSMKSEDGGELFRENHSPENEESNETKESPKVTKIMESMHRKLMLKDKANKKNIHVDDQDQSQRSERSVRNGCRDSMNDQLEGSVKNMNRSDVDQLEGSVRNSHMDHLENLIRGRDRVNQLEESSVNGQNSQRENVTPKTSRQVDESVEESTKHPSDFASKKDYLDWIEYVEGSSHHCFDRSENLKSHYRKDDIDHDEISVGISEGSIEGNNDETLLLKSSKYRKMKSEDHSKGYKKGKGSKVKDSLKSQMVD
ncbi:hypothetical protein N665_1030s0011 [Sinapis alba]|nr:hypothetical protein N665_1030s0011 [Sinapis alba]